MDAPALHAELLSPPSQVTELREALTSFRPSASAGNMGANNMTPLFTTSLRQTFDLVDRSTEAIPPAMFVQVSWCEVCG